ncbi:hypothetical protein EH228_10605 [Erwinia endophytica]|uniref:hypothetical protein n=1 Tax=Erwinia endophytica TaxID=1563158 RepID=UPI001265DA35|nr:hypothetical protein [Erwinia endophytica]KAB8310552.1 hypothetical protein EH228_10605 [Erwinia endophytica]
MNQSQQMSHSEPGATCFSEASSMLCRGDYSRIRLDWEVTTDEFFNLVWGCGDVQTKVVRERDRFYVVTGRRQ